MAGLKCPEASWRRGGATRAQPALFVTGLVVQIPVGDLTNGSHGAGPGPSLDIDFWRMKLSIVPWSLPIRWGLSTLKVQLKLELNENYEQVA